MRYDYVCENCNAEWEETQFLNDRDLPVSLPCPTCQISNKIRRVIGKLFISYDGNKTILQRAGSEWNDVLQRVKKGSGRQNTIETR